MSEHRMFILAALAALVLVAGAFQVPFTAADPARELEEGTGSQPSDEGPSGDLEDVVVGTNDLGYPVVSLVGRGLLDYDSFVLEYPPRLVVDLHGVVSRLETHHFRVGEAGVSRVRAGQFRREPNLVSRVVFDLEEMIPDDLLHSVPVVRVSG